MNNRYRIPPSGGVPHSPLKLVWNIFLFLFGCAFAALIGWIINPRWVGWILYAVAVICVLCAIADARKLFGFSLPVAFTPDGLLDNRNVPQPKLLPWTEIRKVTVHRFRVNMMTASSSLKIEMEESTGRFYTHTIDTDTLRGRPDDLANTICFYANYYSQTPDNQIAPGTVVTNKPG
jgi:hypothetical protein